jgi:hypothetical protein
MRVDKRRDKNVVPSLMMNGFSQVGGSKQVYPALGPNITKDDSKTFWQAHQLFFCKFTYLKRVSDGSDLSSQLSKSVFFFLL